MKLEHVVWVIVAKDRQGKPRGFEKTLNERFYLIEDEARRDFGAMDATLKPFFTVAEARIGYPRCQKS